MGRYTALAVVRVRNQVAAVYGVDVYMFKPLLQGCDLLIPPGGNESVIMAVGNAVEIPLRLGVSD